MTQTPSNRAQNSTANINQLPTRLDPQPTDLVMVYDENTRTSYKSTRASFTGESGVSGASGVGLSGTSGLSGASGTSGQGGIGLSGNRWETMLLNSIKQPKATSEEKMAIST